AVRIGRGGVQQQVAAGLREVLEGRAGDVDRPEVVDPDRLLDDLRVRLVQPAYVQRGRGVDHVVDPAGLPVHPGERVGHAGGVLDADAVAGPGERVDGRAVSLGHLHDLCPDAVAAAEDDQGASGQTVAVG